MNGEYIKVQSFNVMDVQKKNVREKGKIIMEFEKKLVNTILLTGAFIFFTLAYIMGNDNLLDKIFGIPSHQEGINYKEYKITNSYNSKYNNKLADIQFEYFQADSNTKNILASNFIQMIKNNPQYRLNIDMRVFDYQLRKKYETIGVVK